MISILKEEPIDVQFSPVFYVVLMAASGIIFALILGLRVLVILFAWWYAFGCKRRWSIASGTWDPFSRIP